MAGNEEQIEYWNGEAGEVWVRAQENLDAMLGGLSAIAIEKAAPQSSERVIDVGCGCGATSLALAASGAAVWGVDISAPMLEHAKQRASDIDNAVFSQADAAAAELSADHDLIFSRFGVMFFADPVAAFANLRTGLRTGGRLVFLCWQSPAENPWVSLSGRALQPYMPEAEAPDPRAPGPFAFADPNYVKEILGAAGYADIEVESVNLDLHVGDDVESAIRFQGEIGPMSRVLAGLSAGDREAALNAVREVLQPHVTAEGLNLGSATWLVTARNS